MNIKEAIILAGGQGTRLRSITKGGQKVVVKVGKKSFLEILLDQLEQQGFQKVHLALGYRWKEVEEVILDIDLKMEINTVLEKYPLGTGGAIKNALQHISEKNVFVLNGDSLNEIKFDDVLTEHQRNRADITIVTKYVSNIARYGEIKIADSGRIVSFNEKSGVDRSGIINAGIYAIQTDLFRRWDLEKFSFEAFLQSNLNNLNIYALKTKGHFADIGTPEDYAKLIKIYKDPNVY